MTAHPRDDDAARRRAAVLATHRREQLARLAAELDTELDLLLRRDLHLALLEAAA